MIWFVMACYAVAVVLGIYLLGLIFPPPSRCEGPGPHAGELYIVKASVMRPPVVFCAQCRTRRNAINRHYLLTCDREVV